MKDLVFVRYFIIRGYQILQAHRMTINSYISREEAMGSYLAVEFSINFLKLRMLRIIELIIIIQNKKI